MMALDTEDGCCCLCHTSFVILSRTSVAIAVELACHSGGGVSALRQRIQAGGKKEQKLGDDMTQGK